MAWTKIAGSCEQGPCPTIYIDETTGGARIQANRVNPHLPIPDFEGMVEMPPEDWANIVEQILARYAP